MRALLLTVFVVILSIPLVSDLRVVHSSDFKDLAADLERDILAGINAERQASHLPPLVENHHLTVAAREHSQNMARHSYFSHEDRSGRTTRDRIAKAHLHCVVSGENIFQNNLYSRITITGTQRTYQWNSRQEIAESTIRGWMNSPEHRKNILLPQYQLTGVGVAVAPDSKVYITQDFCRPAS
jgi:uncharacterized protein YkwD